MNETTTAGLSPENELFIQRSVETGAFGSRADVLNNALSLLRQRQELLAQVDEGISDIKQGRCTEYNEESLRARFDELKQIALDRAPYGGGEIK